MGRRFAGRMIAPGVLSHYDKVSHELMDLSRSERRYSLQVSRDGGCLIAGNSDFYDPPRERFEIGDVFCDSEPDAISLCKLFDCVVPEASP
jgi:hypothetical protein